MAVYRREAIVRFALESQDWQEGRMFRIALIALCAIIIVGSLATIVYSAGNMWVVWYP
jgi:hypothetical protein